MARHEDRSTDTLESDFEQVCQPVAPQVIQLSAKLVDNRVNTRSAYSVGYIIRKRLFGLKDKRKFILVSIAEHEENKKTIQVVVTWFEAEEKMEGIRVYFLLLKSL